MRFSPSSARRGGQGRYVMASAIVLAVLVAPFAIAAGTGDPVRLGVRNPTGGTTRNATSETQIIASTDTYGTRQSNKGSGGGAIYGCRSTPGNEPCVRALNLSTGRAFEYSFRGNEGGFIRSATRTARPFATDANGVATGLNADRVDSKGAEELTRDAVAATAALNPFAQVRADGTAGQTRGVPTNGVTNPADAGTYRVTFTGDLSNCAFAATLTGTDPGQVTVTPTVAADRSTTAVDVRTFNAAGVAIDRAFHLSGTC